MKAMILAAGLGKRLRPLTDTQPKPLVPVAGKALIVRHIEKLVQAGINDIIINHAWLGEQIVAVLGDGSRWGATITYSAETTPLETGGGILKALPLLVTGTQPADRRFLVINGDIYSDYPLANLPQTITGWAHLIMVNNPDFKPAGDFALINGYVRDTSADRLTFSGISVLSADLFQGCQPGIFPLAPVLRRAITNNQVTGEHYAGYWTDAGTLARLQALEQVLST